MSKPEKNGKFPPWIRVRVGCGSGRADVADILKGLRLNTVCSGAQCPNLGECWHRGTATFMIMGNACTRNCKFCAVSHTEKPEALEDDEPQRVAEAAARLNLKYVVVTSVTRDDLPDGGAGHFVRLIHALREKLPEAGVEVLTPDFKLDADAIRRVVAAAPTVFNHNVETVERLSAAIRGHATYRGSLKVLEIAAAAGKNAVPVKSGIMVGLGETDDEVLEAIRDIRAAGASIITIGQYLPPSKTHWELDRFVEPVKFEEWAQFARDAGFDFVASAPMVRSSYNAGELLGKC